jgi:glutamate dehydrogenase
VRGEAAARRAQLEELGAGKDITDRLVRLYELDGIFGIAALGARKGLNELAVTRAYTRLGEVLGLDWAQQRASVMIPSDPWERLLVAGLARDFQRMRFEFISRAERRATSVERWVDRNPRRIAQFRALSTGPSWSVRCPRRCWRKLPARLESCRPASACRHPDARS